MRSRPHLACRWRSARLHALRWPLVAPLLARPSANRQRGHVRGRVDAARADAARVDAARLVAADSEPGQWLSYGRNYEEQHYSPLAQIDKSNLARLGLAWFADIPLNRGQEATPLYVDGVLYLSSSWSNVFAFDARTGRELWRFDPEVPHEWAVNVCCGEVNRGVAAWHGKIFVGTLDGRLIALDAATGRKVWEARHDRSRRSATRSRAPCAS